MSGYDTTYMYYVYMYYLVATYDNVSLTNDVTQRLLEGSFDMFSRIYKMFLLYYKDSVQNLHVFNVLCPTYICNNDLLVDFFTLMNGLYSRNKDYSQFKHNFYNIHHRRAFKSHTIAI